PFECDALLPGSAVGTGGRSSASHKGGDRVPRPVLREGQPSRREVPSPVAASHPFGHRRFVFSEELPCLSWLPRNGVNQRNRIAGAIERRDGVERTLLESRAEETEGRNRVPKEQRVLQGNTRRPLQRSAGESTPFTNADVE